MTARLTYAARPVPEAPANPNHPLLRWGRENGHPSVTALAELLNVSRTRLSQIVTRKHRPHTTLALTIARVTGLPFEQLLELTPAEVRAGVRAGWERKARAKRPAKRRAK